MKKVIAMALALTMALGMTACGGGGGSSSGEDSSSGGSTELNLILRAGTYADVIKECLPAFEEEHGVTCNVQELSESDLYSGIALDAINADGSYDLCMVDCSWMAEFTENGVLADQGPSWAMNWTTTSSPLPPRSAMSATTFTSPPTTAT